MPVQSVDAWLGCNGVHGSKHPLPENHMLVELILSPTMYHTYCPAAALSPANLNAGSKFGCEKTLLYIFRS